MGFMDYGEDEVLRYALSSASKFSLIRCCLMIVSALSSKT